jgi:hypothetical protein
MISTVTLTFDLTYTNPLTGALEPRGIVTDSTNYSGVGGLGIDLNLSQAKGLGVITFNGDIVADFNTIINPLIDLQDWEFDNPGVTPFFAFSLTLDSNGNVANGVYTLEYSLRLNTSATPFDIITIPTATTIVVDGSTPWLVDFLEPGDEITLFTGAPAQTGVVVSAIEFIDPNINITTSTNILSALYGQIQFDITNVQFSGVFTYSGCVQSAAAVTFSYDCEVGTNGTWAVANSTVLNGQTITSLSATINYPAWTSLTPTFNSQIVTGSLPYSNDVLATGTFSVSLTQVIQRVQTDGLILQYISSGVHEFAVSCAGSLCGLIPCIESLRNAHAAELQRNRISKYQVFVDNVLMYYMEAQNYRSCGDVENYRKTLALIETQIDASGCECGCCDPDTYQWVNNNAASTIDSLINAIQFRLFNADPIGPGSPTPQNDITQGVQVGALWENVDTQVIYICTNNDPNEAEWEEYYAPGVLPTASEIPANPGVILTSGFVQGQLDQIDTLAVFDGINGLNKVGNDVLLGGVLDGTTVINANNNIFEIISDNEPLSVRAGDGTCLLAGRAQTATTGVGQNLILETTSTSGNGANGLGSSIAFTAAPASSPTAFPLSNIVSKWTNATNRSSDLTISTINAGVENVGITLNPDGSLILNEYDGTNQVGSPIYYLGVNNAGLVQKLGIPKVTTFVARINQAGTAAPTITTIFNDTGITFTPVRNAVGSYELQVPAPGFDVASTMVLISNGDIPTVTRSPIVTATITSNRLIIKTKFADTLTLDDDVLKIGYIEVRIYE